MNLKAMAVKFLASTIDFLLFINIINNIMIIYR